MDNLQFGAFVAQLRKEQNMTQKELADALHVTDKAVSKWETGKGFPDVKLLEPLARALGVSLVELMRGQRLEADALPVAEAEQMVSQAMGRSQRSTARRYLKLLSALLIGIGVLCLLQLIPIIGFLIYLGQFNPLFAADDYGIIGGADGPTAIYRHPSLSLVGHVGRSDRRCNRADPLHCADHKGKALDKRYEII